MAEPTPSVRPETRWVPLNDRVAELRRILDRLGSVTLPAAFADPTVCHTEAAWRGDLSRGDVHPAATCRLLYVSMGEVELELRATTADDTFEVVCAGVDFTVVLVVAVEVATGAVLWSEPTLVEGSLGGAVVKIDRLTTLLADRVDPLHAFASFVRLRGRSDPGGGPR